MGRGRWGAHGEGMLDEDVPWLSNFAMLLASNSSDPPSVYTKAIAPKPRRQYLKKHLTNTGNHPPNSSPPSLSTQSVLWQCVQAKVRRPGASTVHPLVQIWAHTSCFLSYVCLSAPPNLQSLSNWSEWIRFRDREPNSIF